jgi:hypothetical protein
MKIQIEMEDNLQEIIQSVSESIEYTLKEFLEDNPDWLDKVNSYLTSCVVQAPELLGDLDHDGAIHSIIDNAVPTKTKELKDLWYLHGDEFEKAFDMAGIGGKTDNDWPMGWKPAAIYCYLEQQALQWYDDNCQEMVEDFNSKRKQKLVKEELNKIKEEELTIT